MRTVVHGGTLIDPKNRIFSELNIAVENGKIVEISNGSLLGDRIINADGCVVSPGFIDMHMHEDSYDVEKDSFDIHIFNHMIRMGVTTAIGGNCGVGPEHPVEYLKAAERLGLPLNFGLLLPHEILRKKIGLCNKYEHATVENINNMREMAQQYLDKGLLGISYGIRYIPGISWEELYQISIATKKSNKLIAAHVRDDAKQVINAATELLELGRLLNVPVQLSHIGSMGAYGQMEELLSLLDTYSSMGVNVGADCYPYNAFSTGIGETTYDDGFLERYETTYDHIEIAEGIYKGKRCTEELFHRLRKEAPHLITIGHVMREEDIDRAIRHPKVAIASDGFMHEGQGHPRASGTFPKIIRKYVKEKNVISLFEAIEKMTVLPAERLGLTKGALNIGMDADIVVFDLNKIADTATFENPASPPDGIKYVMVSGELVLIDKRIVCENAGKVILKK